MSAPRVITPDWQEHLDFLLPKREHLFPAEVAAALRVDVKTVEAWFEASTLTGYTLPPASGTAQRAHKRIRRDSVLLLLVARANSTPDEWRPRLLEIFTKLGARDLDWAAAAITELRKRKPASEKEPGARS